MAPRTATAFAAVVLLLAAACTLAAADDWSGWSQVCLWARLVGVVCSSGLAACVPQLQPSHTPAVTQRAQFICPSPAALLLLSQTPQGRATHYGVNDGMSIHQGSCMFGTLDPNKGTGYDIAAISDQAPDYAGSCGRCYEVACRPSTIKVGGLGHRVAAGWGVLRP
jgi:hypothetical protein